jgi:magnesium chelatase family protein
VNAKTLLAERLPTILPDLADDDALTVTAIRSVVADVRGLVRRPPFQSPHHTATVAALVGGGRGGQPTPGAVTLAHAGVLFLDEAAEFGSACLESLRQPLESGVVCIARAGFTARMPARFQLVLAANPCPCGLGDGAGQECSCRSVDRRRYQAKLSGPLMDRVDIRLVLGPPARGAWSLGDGARDSASVRSMVTMARERSVHRCAALGLAPAHNGAQPSSLLRGPLAPHPAAADVLGAAIAAGRLSARGADRAIRVAWSLADLSGADRPSLEHVGRALTLRGET